MQRHVLVVHRDAELRASLARLLARDGYRVTLEGDGREGLRKARELRPDLIVLGLLAPRLPGREFRDAQKQDAALAGIPVIVVSRLATEPWAGLREVAAVFPRPFDEAALLAAVREHAGRSDPRPHARSPPPAPKASHRRRGSARAHR